MSARGKKNVTLIFKKNKKEDLGNYQLVSLTSMPGKVMKQILLESFSKHFQDKKVLRCSQYRFMKGKACLVNLTAYYDKIISSMDNVRTAIYLDFSKGFDTVFHIILTVKLMNGLGKWTIMLIENRLNFQD